jgi:hypothetical protein
MSGLEGRERSCDLKIPVIVCVLHLEQLGHPFHVS